MRVHLVKEQTIADYCAKHPASKAGFEEWLAKVKLADWKVAEHIQATFGSADLLGGGSERVVFNIGGNSYRMICRYKFARTMVHLSIKFIGTHAEYNKLCGTDKNKKKRPQDPDQFTVNLY
ncbi:MAG TPA: type II toxin-antitoxin system HigB family toxin [Flavisolibacter sp.]|nr:type II toxin-antitoxin system HigB family toxin [Flavisolibacter sp.]